jgi:hypothetical protein
MLSIDTVMVFTQDPKMLSLHTCRVPLNVVANGSGDVAL